MDWEYIKDKILVWGEDEYVFSDIFVSIIGENSTNQDLVTTTYVMLRELMNEKLIDVFVLENKVYMDKKIVDNILYKYETKEDIENFIIKIDKEWTMLNYQLPNPDKLFWLTTTEKGKELILLNDNIYK